jgi:5'-deoxynucleotidase YfbR-like HD superfamily hydrolase
MPVYTPHGMLGNIVDEEEIARKKAEEKALSDLFKYRESEDIKSILNLLLDEKTLPAARKKAADYLEEIGDLKSIEPVRNYSFEDAELEKKVNHAIEMIHKANYTKECPFCAEIIKARAKVCKHCKREV